jgi:hypothetical protein
MLLLELASQVDISSGFQKKGSEKNIDLLKEWRVVRYPTQICL